MTAKRAERPWRTRRVRAGEAMSGQALLQLSNDLLNEVNVVFILSSVTTAVGTFIAYQAYRGYQRNDSRAMLHLAAGIMLLTAIPFAVSTALEAVTTASDAWILLAITVANVAGVAAMFYALTGR